MSSPKDGHEQRMRQMARQWRILRELANPAGVRVQVLAQKLECHVRTVYRDLDALLYAGFPVKRFIRNGESRWTLQAGFKLEDFFGRIGRPAG